MGFDEAYEERIGRARALLESRLDEEIPLEELAAAAHYSVFHFHRLFRGLTGETVREHVRRLRLERAAHRLVRGEGDILSAALDAGYSSHEAFTRAFKARFGVAPSEYREARRRDIEAGLEGASEVEVRIERLETVRVAYVRHVGAYDEVGGAWKALMKWGWTKMMFGKPATFGMCWDDPDVTDPARVRYDACMVVGEGARVKGEVRVQEVAGGSFAVALHEGAYGELGRTYAGLCAAVAGGPIEGRRWSLGDPPSIERYLNDPRKTRPAELRTEVLLRVGPQGMA